ncbi:hypothetical protein Hanom_Chr09g00823271 [Helianthus anomalus]
MVSDWTSEGSSEFQQWPAMDLVLPVVTTVRIGRPVEGSISDLSEHLRPLSDLFPSL